MGARSIERPGGLRAELSWRAGDRAKARRREPISPWRDDSRGLERNLLGRAGTRHREGRRAETGVAANVGDDAPQPLHLDGSANRVKGNIAALLRLRMS